MFNTGAIRDLSFSIANILKVEKPVKGCFTSKHIASKDYEAVEDRTCQLKSPMTSNLPWLAYTRYCPPKIPREYRFEKSLSLKILCIKLLSSKKKISTLS